MPGPRATNRRTQVAAPNNPNKKTAARLKARIEGFSQMVSRPGEGLQYHKPGSQNRNK